MKHPLRWKLVTLYAAILVLVIGGFALALVLRLRQTGDEAADAECRAQARALAAALDLDAGAWIVEPDSGIDSDFESGRGRYYVVADAGGRVLLASPLATALGLAPGMAGAGGSRELRSGGARWRESTLPVTIPADPDDDAPETALRIVCGQDMARADDALAALAAQLVVIGPLVLLAALGGGFFLVSRALRPIDRMARAASEIGATDLSRRLDDRGGDELASLARTLNATFARLQDAFERQTRFTADASHELRTPLSVIAGNVELALARPRESGEYRAMILDIREASDRMRAIVEGLLTLARADAGSQPFARAPVALGPLAVEAVRLHGSLAERHGVSVSLEDGGGAVVRGDADRLQELLANLLANAIRYNRPGGRVAVRLARDDGHVRLTVADTGIGIASEHLPRIFERFYRVDAARGRDGGGSGLGLAIAKWIVDAHAGEIAVASEPGSGTVFSVRLPAGA